MGSHDPLGDIFIFFSVFKKTENVDRCAMLWPLFIPFTEALNATNHCISRSNGTQSFGTHKKYIKWQTERLQNVEQKVLHYIIPERKWLGNLGSQD
jgi:hypothetical protein